MASPQIDRSPRVVSRRQVMIGVAGLTFAIALDPGRPADAAALDADWDNVRIVPVPIVEKVYGNPAFGGSLTTAGSTAVTAYYDRLRIFGAQVRRILLENAAGKWGVPVDELHTEPSVVVHKHSGRRLGYGEIVGFATIPAVAPEIRPEQLKKTSAFRLIGKEVMRVELPGKVNG